MKRARVDVLGWSTLSRAEDALLAHGVEQMYGENWATIRTQLLPHRTEEELRRAWANRAAAANAPRQLPLPRAPPIFGGAPPQPPPQQQPAAAPACAPGPSDAPSAPSELPLGSTLAPGQTLIPGAVIAAFSDSDSDSDSEGADGGGGGAGWGAAGRGGREMRVARGRAFWRAQLRLLGNTGTWPIPAGYAQTNGNAVSVLSAFRSIGGVCLTLSIESSASAQRRASEQWAGRAMRRITGTADHVHDPGLNGPRSDLCVRGGGSGGGIPNSLKLAGRNAQRPATVQRKAKVRE